VDVRLYRRINLYLRESGTSATSFGLDSAGDPKLVFDIRRGRKVRRPLRTKLLRYLQQAERALGDKPCRRRR
jgi:hypothetical protein